jgi:S-DNA-T family DNA segregation ATPase FtsK/SpoIIIE
MNNSPEDLRLVMVDPKMVEMVRFNGLPHLFGKVETELQRMLAVLRWTVAEMDRRYKLMEKAHARDIDAYNTKMRRTDAGEVLPRVVTLIDELADLMMISSEQTEASLVRLAQMGRATGIHLVLATQRPSTDVVTGLIKANFPARISFAVASSIDSRVILDVQGAESLLGRGDMLYLPPEAGGPVRVQGVMISDKEVERVIDYWRASWQAGEEGEVPWENFSFDDGEEEDEALIEEAAAIVRQSGRASASMLQRRLRIGYPRAARLIDQLEELGVVGPSMGPGKEREILLEDEVEDE